MAANSSTASDEHKTEAAVEVALRVEAMDGRTVMEVSLQLPIELSGNIGEWEVAARE